MSPHLYDVVDRADLESAIEQRLVNVRFSSDGDRIYNYSDGAMYTPGAWDSHAVRVCRGLIVDEDDQIIARPWVKFFNHGQAEAGALDMDAPVEVTDKIDGSLGILHLDDVRRPHPPPVQRVARARRPHAGRSDVALTRAHMPTGSGR